MNRRAAVAVVVTALWAASSASAALQSDPRLDAVASGIAGFPVTVVGEDTKTEWALLDSACPDCRGYSYPLASPTDPNYHKVFIGPIDWPTLEQIETGGIASVPTYQAAEAVLTLIHETTHLKLASTDEGRVEACAVQSFPSIITMDFGVAPTVVRSTQRRISHRVRIHSRWVIRYRVITTTNVVPNPTYVALTSQVQAIWTVEQQSPPYFGGVCS